MGETVKISNGAAILARLQEMPELAREDALSAQSKPGFLLMGDTEAIAFRFDPDDLVRFFTRLSKVDDGFDFMPVAWVVIDGVRSGFTMQFEETLEAGFQSLSDIGDTIQSPKAVYLLCKYCIESVEPIGLSEPFVPCKWPTPEFKFDAAVPT